MDYHYHSNTIHAEPLKTRTGVDLKSAYHKIHTLLTDRGVQPSLHILDNECPNALNVFMREVNEKFKLVPPYIHRKNSEERSIRNFEEHFIAGLVSTQKDFPLNIWCRLIPHVSLTLKLLQKLYWNPKLSGYARLNG